MKKMFYTVIVFTFLISIAILFENDNIISAENFNVMYSSQNFQVDGEPVNANALNINGSNYIKVAEFAQLLDIDIEFDENTNTVKFDKTKPFTVVRTTSENAPQTEFQEVFKIENLKEEDISYMTGKSYDPENAISTEELRKLTITHIGFDDKPHYGEIIVNKAVAEEVLDIFKELYDAKYPIEKVVLIDAYNGNDILSMEDNNTSCYNNRYIAGTTTLSNHAKGLAIDINPLVNPYVKGDYVSPISDKDYVDRTKNEKGMIHKNDACYNAFIKRGWTWGGDWNSPKDYQHFEKEIY